VWWPHLDEPGLELRVDDDYDDDDDDDDDDNNDNDDDDDDDNDDNDEDHPVWWRTSTSQGLSCESMMMS
jgi:hypothetical protein